MFRKVFVLFAVLLPLWAAAENLVDELKREFVTPVRLVELPDTYSAGVSNAASLLRPFDGQLAVSSPDVCVLTTREGRRGAVLLDFGKELCGGIELAAPLRGTQKALKVRICLGESVSEALSDVSAEGATATNEHSLRDFTVDIPWLGTLEVGNSGFRFALVELVEPEAELPLRAVRAVSRYRDLPYVGSFESNDKRLNDIWRTGAYTVHLNMQNYLWDGVKRDRLVWVGDLHPEVMTIANVFGDYGVVKKSLDFARDTSPLPGWMNGIAAYSMWWVIIHRDLCLYSGDTEYLREQLDYMGRLVDCFADGLDGNRENYQGGQRLLDWPTSEMPEVIHSGYQSLLVMAMEAAAQIGEWTGDKALKAKTAALLKKIRSYNPPTGGAKQSAALAILAGTARDRDTERDAILAGKASGFSTFYGYYMLEALAASGAHADAIDILSDYWGRMLDLGATTFWEDLDYEHGLKAARIDDIVPDGAFDIHKSSGNYCYKGHRHSFCHGWASGPTPWLSRHVLGVRPVKPGFEEVVVEPHLGRLESVEGTVPTPRGVIEVSHTRMPDGKVKTTIHAPEGIKVIRK